MFDSLKQRFNGLAPIILEGSSEGHLRILERSSRFAIDLNAADLEDEKQDVFQRLESALQRVAKSGKSLGFKVWVHTKYDQLEVEGAAAATVALCNAFPDGLPPKVGVYADRSHDGWSEILGFTRFVRQNLANPKKASIMLTAPLDEANETVIEEMLEWGILMKVAAGWQPDVSSDELPLIDKDILKQISERGPRTIIEWFVHAGNMAAFERCIDELLVLNYSSGFTVPLVSQSPFYRFATDQPTLPEPMEYGRFLVRLYRKYPHFDTLMQPLNGIATNIVDGAWDYNSNLASELPVLLEDGRVKLFKRSPAFSIDWMSYDDVASMEPERLRKKLLTFASDVFAWDKFAYCNECEWRYACGGHGANESLGATEATMDALCMHRKLFLGHFARMRAADRLPALPAN